MSTLNSFSPVLPNNHTQRLSFFSSRWTIVFLTLWTSIMHDQQIKLNFRTSLTTAKIKSNFKTITQAHLPCFSCAAIQVENEAIDFGIVVREGVIIHLHIHNVFAVRILQVFSERYASVTSFPTGRPHEDNHTTTDRFEERIPSMSCYPIFAFTADPQLQAEQKRDKWTPITRKKNILKKYDRCVDVWKFVLCSPLELTSWFCEDNLRWLQKR